MIRRAGAQDVAGLEAFLRANAETAMFPLANLRQHGLEGSQHPRATAFWIAEDPNGIAAALGVSTEGFAFPVMPETREDLMAWVRTRVAGRRLQGILGPRDQAHAVRAAFGLAAASLQHAGDEPHYALDLAALVTPPAESYTLIAPDPGHAELMTDWRAQFLEAVIRAKPAAALEKARQDISAFIAAGSHRLLLRDADPVAMTGFSAALAEIVQVGAVYTPPALRSRHLARIAVALHLAEARARGARRAVLFAANPAAARAYEAIGFQRIGWYSMLLFDQPQEVAPCAA